MKVFIQALVYVIMQIYAGYVFCLYSMLINDVHSMVRMLNDAATKLTILQGAIDDF